MSGGYRAARIRLAIACVSLLASVPLQASDADADRLGIPVAVRVRMAEAAHGGPLGDYAVGVEQGKTVYSCTAHEAGDGALVLITVGADGALRSVLPIAGRRPRDDGPLPPETLRRPGITAEPAPAVAPPVAPDEPSRPADNARPAAEGLPAYAQPK